MRIKFRQSGGFAGLIRGCEVLAADLSKREQHELERLCTAAKLHRVKPVPAQGADRQFYELQIEHDDGAVIDVKFDDSALTDGAAPLIAFLRARAKPMPIK